MEMWQVKKCIWNHSSEARVYLACNMLGQEILLETIARDFGVKIFVDKDQVSNYYADLEMIAPDFLTTDKESTRFEVLSALHRTLSSSLSMVIVFHSITEW